MLHAEPVPNHSICQIATATANPPILNFDNPSDEASMKSMRGMTAKNFDPVRYSGRWFEVASLKRGFAGQGQEDCHCTQVKSYISVFYCYLGGHGRLWYLPESTSVAGRLVWCQALCNSPAFFIIPLNELSPVLWSLS